MKKLKGEDDSEGLRKKLLSLGFRDNSIEGTSTKNAQRVKWKLSDLRQMKDSCTHPEISKDHNVQNPKETVTNAKLVSDIQV